MKKQKKDKSSYNCKLFEIKNLISCAFLLLLIGCQSNPTPQEKWAVIELSSWRENNTSLQEEQNKGIDTIIHLVIQNIVDRSIFLESSGGLSPKFVNHIKSPEGNFILNSHKYNSISCHPPTHIEVKPGHIIKLNMHDKDINAGKIMLIVCKSKNDNNNFKKEITVPKTYNFWQRPQRLPLTKELTLEILSSNEFMFHHAVLSKKAIMEVIDVHIEKYRINTVSLIVEGYLNDNELSAIRKEMENKGIHTTCTVME